MGTPLSSRHKAFQNDAVVHRQSGQWHSSSRAPLYLVILVTITVFLSEAVIMYVLRSRFPLPLGTEMVLDATLLVALIVPVLYVFLFRPLQLRNAEGRRQEREIRRQNEFLRSIIDSLPHPFYVIDVNDYTFKIANDAGGGQNQLEGLTCYAHTHKSDQPCGGSEHPCPLEDVKRTKRPVVVEHIHFDAEGKARNFEVHGYPVFDDEGNVIQMIESSLDITDRKRAEEKLRVSEGNLKDFFENANDLIQFVDKKGHLLYVNRAWKDTLGYSEEELKRISAFDIIKKDDLPHCRSLFMSIFEGNSKFRAETVFISKDGREIPVEGNVDACYKDGVFLYTRGIFRDMAERKLAEKMLRDEREFSQELIQHSAVPTFVVDIHHKVIHWNNACEQLTGLKASEVVGTSDYWKAFYDEKRPCLADFVVGGQNERASGYYTIFGKSALTPNGLHAEGWYQNLGGKRRYISFDAAPIYNSGGELVAAIETLQDISKIKALEEELQVTASTDKLTGIYNRRMLESILKKEIARARRYQSPLSLLMFDLDHFKIINDIHGHQAGDYVLKKVSSLVAENIRQADYFGRWGGEEFMILVPEATMEEAEELADKIRSTIGSYAFEEAGTVTISCGLAQFKDGDTIDRLIRRADDALYIAKNKGRNTIVVGD